MKLLYRIFAILGSASGVQVAKDRTKHRCVAYAFTWKSPRRSNDAVWFHWWCVWVLMKTPWCHTITSRSFMNTCDWPPETDVTTHTFTQRHVFDLTYLSQTRFILSSSLLPSPWKRELNKFNLTAVYREQTIQEIVEWCRFCSTKVMGSTREGCVEWTKMELKS